jgi:IS5 family transposase
VSHAIRNFCGVAKANDDVVLQRVAGKDASKQFWKYHNKAILAKYQKLKIGSLNSKAGAGAAAAGGATEEALVTYSPEDEAPREREDFVPLEPYGDIVPYADPNWYQTVRVSLCF